MEIRKYYYKHPGESVFWPVSDAEMKAGRLEKVEGDRRRLKYPFNIGLYRLAPEEKIDSGDAWRHVGNIHAYSGDITMFNPAPRTVVYGGSRAART